MKMMAQSVSQIKCRNYLSIKPVGSETFVSIEEYYQKIVEKNKKCKFEHKKLANCKFNYRGEILRYNELCTINYSQMELPQFYDITALKEELFGTVVQEHGYCLRLLKTLDRYLAKARFEAIKAATLLDIDFLNSDANRKVYSWQYFQRCYFAENAIYTYYSLYEIVILLIYICKNQNCGLKFNDYASQCRSGSFRRELKNNDYDLFLLVSDGSPDAKIHPDFAKINTWCNMFKHRGIIRFDGEQMEDQPQTVFVPETNSGLKTYFSSNNEFTYIDLDNDVIPEFVNYHQKIIELAKRIIEHCKIKESEIVIE